MLKSGDSIQITNGSDTRVPVTSDEQSSRYACSSDIVLALYLAHPDLPEEVAKSLQGKLEKQDVYSLEDLIKAKANQILQTWEEAGTSCARRTTPSYSQPRRQPQRAPPSQAKQKILAPSRVPKKIPSKTQHHCSVCKQNPQRASQASTHFLKDCPHLSEGDRNFIFNLFDKALKNRVVDPTERDPEIGDSVIDLVEEYYDLLH